MKENTTHFGYQEVPTSEKVKKVGAVFDSVATKYDIMNDVMSMGVHRLWKWFALEVCAIQEGEKVLDIASGTGDLAAKHARRAGDNGMVIASDINNSMLSVGRDRLTDKGIIKNVRYVQADAEQLPFPDNHFDCITIAFGLRNVTDKDTALASMQRVLKPGGRLLVLEFSKPHEFIKSIYDAYSFKLLPLFGKLIAKDEESYRYLAESIRMHPDQETLKQMALDAGFDQCDYMNLSGGIVAMHRAYKF